MKDQKNWTLFFILISVSALLTLVNLSETLREPIRNFLLPERRQVLAKATGHLTGTNDIFTVLKVKNRDSLAIEVYQDDNDSDKGVKSSFRARHIFTEKRDGYFTFHGNAVNILLMDVNNDQSMEILTSTYDENLVPKMHVLHFDSLRLDFEELGPETLNL